MDLFNDIVLNTFLSRSDASRDKTTKLVEPDLTLCTNFNREKMYDAGFNVLEAEMLTLYHTLVAH